MQRIKYPIAWSTKVRDNDRDSVLSSSLRNCRAITALSVVSQEWFPNDYRLFEHASAYICKIWYLLYVVPLITSSLCLSCCACRLTLSNDTPTWLSSLEMSSHTRYCAENVLAQRTGRPNFVGWRTLGWHCDRSDINLKFWHIKQATAYLGLLSWTQ